MKQTFNYECYRGRQMWNSMNKQDLIYSPSFLLAISFEFFSNKLLERPIKKQQADLNFMPFFACFFSGRGDNDHGDPQRRGRQWEIEKAREVDKLEAALNAFIKALGFWLTNMLSPIAL